MDLTDEITKISRHIMETLSNRNIAIGDIDLILAQVKREICASIKIKPENSISQTIKIEVPKNITKEVIDNLLASQRETE